MYEYVKDFEKLGFGCPEIMDQLSNLADDLIENYEDCDDTFVPADAAAKIGDWLRENQEEEGFWYQTYNKNVHWYHQIHITSKKLPHEYLINAVAVLT